MSGSGRPRKEHRKDSKRSLRAGTRSERGAMGGQSGETLSSGFDMANVPSVGTLQRETQQLWLPAQDLRHLCT